MTYPHHYHRETVFTGCGWPYRCRCGEGDAIGGERGDNCPAAMREDIARLEAEVRRLTPTPKSPPEPKIATWMAVAGRPNMRVLVCGGRDVAHYDHSGFGLWFVNVYGYGIASWATEDAARADVLAWAKSKGWEVRDGG